MNKKYSIILKWAILLGVGTSLLQLFKSYTSELPYFSYGPLIDLMLVLIFIGALFLGIKEYRDQVMDGKIKFSKAFSISISITAITFCIYFLFQILHYTVIDQDGLAKINARNEKRFVERIENDTVRMDVLTNQADLVLASIDSSQANYLLNTEACETDVTNRLTVIKEFYKIRLLNVSLADSAQLLVKNVDYYAQKVLIDLTETVINEKEMDVACAGIVTDIIENTLQIIRGKRSILEESLENAEGKPMTFTNVYAASFTFSISILIYGLFFGLFVSLYLYKRENKQFVEKNEKTENDENLE